MYIGQAPQDGLSPALNYSLIHQLTLQLCSAETQQKAMSRRGMSLRSKQVHVHVSWFNMLWWEKGVFKVISSVINKI